MKVKKHKIDVSGTTVSAESYVPDKMKSLFIFAHGAGAPMQHPFMTGLSKTLAELGIGSLRYNFPSMELKKGRPDTPAVAHAAVAAAVSAAAKLYPKVSLYAGGKSFGGRMTSQWAAKFDTQPVKGLIFVGFPLHPPGKPSVERAAHLKDIKLPMLFLQGTRDALAEWDLIAGVCKGLPLARLEKFESADHSFKIPKTNAFPLLADAIRSFVTTSK